MDMTCRPTYKDSSTYLCTRYQGSKYRTVSVGTVEISLFGEQTGTGDPCFVPLFIPSCFGLFQEVPVVPAEILISVRNQFRRKFPL